MITIANIQVLGPFRRTLSKQERLKYIDSVKCLMKKPALTDKKDLPGAKSRYDDFLGTHIVRADDVHFVVSTILYNEVDDNTELTCRWHIGRFLSLPPSPSQHL